MVKLENSPMTEPEYYILLALREPMHGYGLMSAISELSHGRISMGPGTLYGVLTRMLKQKRIALDHADNRRKTYSLTPSGQNALKQEFLRLSAMVHDGQSFCEEIDDEK